MLIPFCRVEYIDTNKQNKMYFAKFLNAFSLFESRGINYITFKRFLPPLSQSYSVLIYWKYNRLYYILMDYDH